MDKCKEMIDFNMSQFVMARRLGQSISKTTVLVGCSQYAVVSTYQERSREGQLGIGNRENVMFWAMFWWETLGPGIHMSLL